MKNCNSEILNLFKVSCLSIFLAFLFIPLNGQNNGIYNGSNGTGYTYTLMSQVENNSIFQGGIDDGYDADSHKQETNMGIFAGGSDDGYSFSFGSISVNNNIFQGGIDDGYVYRAVSIANQNMIFSGGMADGFDIAFAEKDSGNGIFAGGKDDGYHTSGISKLIWTGLQSTDWLMADNWNVRRTPVSNDYVLISQVQTRYPLLTGKLRIGNSGIYTYTCQTLNIQYLANVTGNSNAWLENYGNIEIFGLLEFTAHPQYISKNLGTGMIRIHTLGRFNILE